MSSPWLVALVAGRGARRRVVRSPALRFNQLAEFLARMRLQVRLHGHHFAGDGRRARGERRQRDERHSRRRS